MAEMFTTTFGEMAEILERARNVYGNKNQIMVCIEELNELACVLAKYPRYTDECKATQELYDKALDEVADVYTILEHVKAIFNMSEEEVIQRRFLKVSRVKKWLSHSESMQETVDDRELEEEMSGDCRNTTLDEKKEDYCVGCVRNRGNINANVYDCYCAPCLKAQATEGRAPYKYSIN